MYNIESQQKEFITQNIYPERTYINPFVGNQISSNYSQGQEIIQQNTVDKIKDTFDYKKTYTNV